MQLNVTTDYAIRIVLYLAIKKEITTSAVMLLKIVRSAGFTASCRKNWKKV